MPAGKARLVLLFTETDEDPSAKRARAAKLLENYKPEPDAPLNAGRMTLADGIYFSPRPLKGELAFNFTGAASAYAGMGRELLMAFPELAVSLEERFKNRLKYVGGLYGAGVSGENAGGEKIPEAFEQLCGSSYLCQLHYELTGGLLGIKPDVAMGLSSGETNSIIAFGLWRDMDEFLGEIDASKMYSSELSRGIRGRKAILEF